MKPEFTELKKQSKRHYKNIFNNAWDFDVISYDTETVDGKVKLIADSEGNYLLNPDIDEILAFLSRPEYHKHLKTFYNLAYDAEAIIKDLEYLEIPNLYFLKKCEHGNYTIRYIPKKVFSTKIKNRLYSFFDIYQFYKTSLDNAASYHLGKQKHDVDVIELKDEDFTEDNRKLIEYCIHDARLTAELTELMRDKMHELNINFFKPYSTGNIAEQYVIRNTKMRHFYPSKIQEFAYNNYSGGRFELLKRGYFDKAYHYDINSAYPSVISKLPHISSCSLHIVKQYHPEALIGFYEVYIPESDFNKASIFVGKKDGINIYPNIHEKTVILSQPEMRFLIEYTDIDYEIVNGRILCSEEPIYPFNFIPDMYKKRKEIEGADKMLAHAIKLVMNSIYGKFWQVNERIVVDHQEGYDLARVGAVPFHRMMFKKEYVPGQLFYPIYASHITASVRIQLLESIWKKRNKIIAFHTDSVTSEVKLPFNSTELGDWNYVTEGEGLFLVTGVYSIRNENGCYERERGGKGELKENWFEILKKHKNDCKIPLTMKRRLTIGDVIQKSIKYDFSDLNRFIYAERVLDLKEERKRIWYDDINCAYDLLQNSFDSKPMYV